MDGSINRRSMIGGLAAGLGATACAHPSQFSLGESSSQPPNIVFIMADDMGYADLGCTGSPYIKTPHLDSLARNGLLLEQGYSNSAICSPTRTALLSGCYQYRFQVGLEEPLISSAAGTLGLPHDRATLASVFKDMGYETALIGKWHLGQSDDHNPLAHGYDQFFGIKPGAADYFRHRSVRGGREVGSGLMRGREEIEMAGYLTDLLGDEAVRVVENTSGKPLFLSLHFTAPHWPWEGREDEEVSRQLQDYFHRDGGTLETYARMMQAMDDNVGWLIAALKRRGIYDNTIIVFTSDNGGERFSNTWPFVGVKGELLEGGIRVPTLVQWPGRIRPGARSQQVMVSMDFLPTLAALAGGQVDPADFDGFDVSAQLLSRAPNLERTLFWRYKANEQKAVRKGDWKYLKIAGKEHLFNVATDPRERASLQDRYPDRFAALKAEYDDWNSQMLPYPESSYSEDASRYYSDRY